jgi:hypothetical protein
MDTTPLLEVASKAGVLGSAMIDALNRGQLFFSAKEPTQEHLTAWITSLKQEAPHLFSPPAGHAARSATVSEDVPTWLSPAERLTRYRQTHPQAPVERKPQPYTPTPQQLKELDGLPPMQKLARYREWQGQAHRTGGTVS